MSTCIHNKHGKCQIFDEASENPGCDGLGNCICDDDEDPGYTCEDYKGDDE